MRLLIVIDQFSTGGGARVVSRLLDGFVESGHEILLATKPFGNSTHYPINSNVQVLDFEPKPSTKIPLLRSISFLLSGIKCCSHLIKETKPDVIIAEMAGNFFLSYFGATKYQIPVIAHDHTSFQRKLNLFYNFIRFHFYDKANALVILTEKDKRVLGERFPRKEVIYNPLPFEVLDNYSIKNRRNSILCVGRFDVWEVKGFDIILRIFKNLTITHQDWKLEFAGSGSPEATCYMKTLVTQYGLGDKVVFLGQVSDMKTLYQEVKVFALPSRIEGLPMGLMEAMSQGCASVAFEVGGATNEMIANGKSGFHITDGDEDSFEKALDQLMNDDFLISSIGHSAIIEATKFALPNIMRSWNNLFATLK